MRGKGKPQNFQLRRHWWWTNNSHSWQICLFPNKVTTPGRAKATTITKREGPHFLIAHFRSSTPCRRTRKSDFVYNSLISAATLRSLCNLTNDDACMLHRCKPWDLLFMANKIKGMQIFPKEQQQNVGIICKCNSEYSHHTDRSHGAINFATLLKTCRRRLLDRFQ